VGRGQAIKSALTLPVVCSASEYIARHASDATYKMQKTDVASRQLGAACGPSVSCATVPMNHHNVREAYLESWLAEDRNGSVRPCAADSLIKERADDIQLWADSGNAR
jgi:hypothetical protein